MSAPGRDAALDEIERDIRAGGFEAAEKRAAGAARAHPESARAQHLLGAALHGQGKLDRAIACYRKSAQLGGASAELHGDLGHALLEKGRPREALESFETAMRADPRDDRACTGAATALREAGDIVASRRMFQRALRLRVGNWLRAPFRRRGAR